MTSPDAPHRPGRADAAEQWARVRPMVEAVLGVPVGSRGRYLAEHCAGDEAFRRDVERMVRAYEAAEASDDFLAGAAAAAAEFAADVRKLVPPSAVHPFAGSPRFELTRTLGAGGMGVVFEAVDRQSAARVALKLLPVADPDALFRFKREFRSLAALEHPNLVELYELVAEDDQWFFTMELVDGVDFLDWVRNGRHIRDDPAARPPFDAIADERRLRDAMAQLTDGISALHGHGVLHRDLKPSNVLVRPDGQVVILDFGIAVGLGDTTRTTAHLGTPPYMSPEQFAGHSLTAASDWYSMGVMLYEALTGKTPFTGTAGAIFLAKSKGVVVSPSKLVRGVPADLEALCLALLAAEPALRPAADETIARLAAVIEGDDERSPTMEEPTPVFVGRVAQLDALESALDAVRRGASRTVYVRGPSGGGKSALIAHFLGEAGRDEGVLVLEGRCDEQESVPFKAVDAVVDALSSWLRTRSPQQLAHLLPTEIAFLGRLFPVLVRVGAIAAARGGVIVRDPREVRRRAFGVLRALLSSLGETATVVVVIDDLQWGDDDSGELLAHLLTGAAPPRMLFVATYRSEYEHTSPCLQVLATAHAARRDGARPDYLTLSALNAAEAQTLARSLLPPGSNDDVVNRVSAESDGNPFFMHELARYVRTRPGWPHHASEAPFDLERALWARIEALPSVARELLGLVAIAGRPVRNDVWRDASGEAARDPHALALLRHAHLLRSTGSAPLDEVETYHDRIRETIVARLEPAIRRRHHQSLATALAARPDADQETVAVHFAECGEIARASAHFARAAEGAERALAFARAGTLYQRALESPLIEPGQRCVLLTSMGNALANAGRGQLAAQAYERAATIAGADERLDLQRMAATQYAISGHVDEGRALFMHVLRGVGLGSPQSSVALMAQLIARRVQLRLRGLHFVERTERDIPLRDLRRIDALRAVSTALGAVDVVRVAAFQSQALLLALAAGEPRRLALALSWEAVLTATGGPRTARRSSDMLRLASSLANRVESPQARGMVDFADGWVAFLHGRFSHAVTAGAKAEEIFRDQCTGAWWELSTTRTMMAWAMSHCGDNLELGVRLRAWEPEARARGDHFMVTNLLAFPLPYERLVADDIDGAESFLHEALVLWPYRGFHIQHVSVLFSRALMLLYSGAGADACTEVTRRWPAMVRSLQTQNQVTRVMLRDVRARGALQAAAAGVDRARHLARAARDVRAISRERCSWAAGYVERLNAGLAHARGDDAGAIRALETAETSLASAGLALQATIARRQRGLLAGGSAGGALVESADAAMHSRGVVNVDAMSAMLGVAGV